jgi:hypothetical protein
VNGVGEPGGSRPFVALGVVVVLVAVVGAAVMFLVGRSRVDDAVRSLARAPVGCDTTLEFSATGTFVVFVETSGRIDQVDGGCDAPTTYDRRGAGVPDVMIELRGPTSQDVPVRPADVGDYDIEGFVGASTGEIEIDVAGRYVVRVSSTADDFAVAIGRDPESAARPLWIGAALIIMAGLVGGTSLVVVGIARGRRDETPANDSLPPPPAFVPGGEIPSAPPLAPPPPGTIVSPLRGEPAPWPPPSGGSAATPPPDGGDGDDAGIARIRGDA